MDTPERSTGPIARDDANANADAIARRVKRQLLMGAALMLAFASIYAGVFDAGRAIQVGLAAIATACVLLAVRIGQSGRSADPPSS
jgi:hypothetical protein